MAKEAFENSLRLTKLSLLLSGIRITRRKWRKSVENFFDYYLYYISLSWLYTDVCGELNWLVEGILTGKSFIDLSLTAPCITISMLATSKSIFLYWNRDVVAKIVDKLRDIHPEDKEFDEYKQLGLYQVESNEPDVEKEIVEESRKFLSFVVHLLFYICAVVICAFPLMPVTSMAYDYYTTGSTEYKYPYLVKYFFDPYTMKMWPAVYFHHVMSNRACVTANNMYVMVVGAKGDECLPDDEQVDPEHRIPEKLGPRRDLKRMKRETRKHSSHSAIETMHSIPRRPPGELSMKNSEQARPQVTKMAANGTAIVGANVFGSDSLFYVVCIYIQMHFRTLCHRCECAVVSSREGTRRNVANAVKRHQELIDLVNQVELLYSKSTLFNIVTSSVLICLCSFIITVLDEIIVVVTFATFLVMNLSQISLLCYFGDILMRSSTEVSSAVYNSLWYETDQSVKKNMLVILMRAQKPCKLTAWNFADLNLTAFTTILSRSWSYFALLKTMYK